MAVPLLPQELTGAMLEVSVAWGADLTDLTGASWTWTDITTDVRQDPGINISLGRSDEAGTTQPANLTLTLDNTYARYSLGPTSPNYPNVRRGTPVRVRVRPSTAGAYTVVFQGSAVGWQPDWNPRGNIPTVALEAAGALRRLAQGTAPVQSPIRRYHANPAAVAAVAYWPCEDGRQATQFAPVVGAPPMTWAGGPPKLANDTSFVASQPLPTINSARVTGDVPPYPPNATDGSQGARLVMSLPAAGGIPDGTILYRAWLSGTVARIDLRYGAGGSLALRTYDNFNTQLSDTGPFAFNVDGRQFLASVEMFQSGPNMIYGLNVLFVGDTVYFLIPGTQSVAGTCGVIRRVQVGPDGNLGAAGFGHVAVLRTRSATDPLTEVQPQLNAYVGEYTTDRLPRLCSENAVPLAYSNTPYDGSSFVSYTLGPQALDSVLPLLRSVEKVARGLLYDGLSAGLYYRTRSHMENQAAALTVDAGMGQLPTSFDVVDDDQRLINKATINRPSGSAVTYQDATGAVGTNTVGTYETSDEVNVQTDEGAALHAGWLVSRGTTVGYRYPTVSVNLRSSPTLAAAWLSVIPGSRIDVANVSAALAGHPPGTLSLFVEGVTHSFSDGEWTGVAKCSPYDIWAIGSVGAATAAGDDAWVLRADADATTTSAIGPASTSVTVSSNPVWITTAGFPAEFPFDVEIGGRQITVTAISGATSPQTFTITAPGVSIPSGSTVRLWRPRRVGL